MRIEVMRKVATNASERRHCHDKPRKRSRRTHAIAGLVAQHVKHVVETSVRGRDGGDLK